MTVYEMNLSELITKCRLYPDRYFFSPQITELNRMLTSGQITASEFAEYARIASNGQITPVLSKSGNILSYTYNDAVSLTTSGINSNAQNIARSSIRSAVNTGVTNNIATSSRILTPAAAGSNWAYVANSVASPIAAAATGIALGKLIDSALYNLNPDFWDSNGMGSINPETWNSITMDVDYTDPITGAAATAFNFIFGLDPDANKAQAYMDEDAFAYMAYYLKEQGVFNRPEYTGNYNSSTIQEILDAGWSFNYPISNYTNPVHIVGVNSCIVSSDLGNDAQCHAENNIDNVYFFAYRTNTTSRMTWSYSAFSLSPFTIVNDLGVPIVGAGASNRIHSHGIEFYMPAPSGGSFYWYVDSQGRIRYYPPALSTINNDPTILNPPYQGSASDICLLLYYGDIQEGTVIEGISDQPNATLPIINNWVDVPTTLLNLRSQYPDLWENAIDYSVIQPDGTVQNKKGIPVPWPLVNGSNDLQPVSGDSLQTNPSVSIDDSTAELIESLTKILVNPAPDPFTDTDTENPPDNPTDSGEGSSISPIPISGSASSMWAIYHPTQAQVDDFGAWLWSADFIDQIAKIFNNPMESIIGLHKIFATPIDAGQATIKVGYLDSEVPSAYITQQYVYIDCGTVDLFEQFGNVFDYSPYTSINLYLPFIGIVPLDVADVMRSTINITYGVDVITGACLAMVEISRDSYNSIQYQYSGNCAVQYPLSSGSYMGIVASIISVAGSIVATAASGGAAAPLALGAAGAALNAHTQVQHSGSYSGNAGAMGGKKPYLIISRPITKIADNFNVFSGYPANAYVLVGDCEGYIKADEAHIIDVNATEDELNEIYSLLIGGVII